MKKELILKKVLVCCMLFSVFYATNASALTMITDSTGQLLGARGVQIDDVYYDVDFYDGTANSMWGPDYDFTFGTSAGALEASEALMSLVFTGIYDSNPNLTSGINGVTESIAKIATPYYKWTGDSDNLNVAFAQNAIDDDADGTSTGYMKTWVGLTTDGMHTYAVWSAASPVPEPATMLLFGIGLLGLAGVNRRKTA